MDFESENTNDDFFNKMHSTDGKRTLSQIFEDDNKPLQSESSNLRYQPQQQQDKLKTKPQSSTGRSKAVTESVESWITVIAKVAYGYNGSDNMGRVGIALSRNGAGAAKFVIYKSRNHLLSTLLLTKSTTSSVPKDGTCNVIMRESYMQFYDDEQHFWSLRFELTADEEEFTEALLNIGLSVEQMGPEKSKRATPPTPTLLSQPQGLPQPLPRQKHKSKEDDATSSNDSESESTQSTEDNFTTPQPTSTMESIVSVSTVYATPLSTHKMPPQPGNQIEVILDEERAKRHDLDMKMDTLLLAMSRLTNNGQINISEHSEQDKKKVDSLALKTSGYQFNDTMNTTIQESSDNEDKLLELEQKLLDFKKQNRSLVKSLKAREQTIAELRAFCKELLTQNNDLKKQYAALTTAISNQVKAESINAVSHLSSINCANCDNYIRRIKETESRALILAEALNNLGKETLSPH